MRKIFILTAVGFASAALLPMSASYAAPVTSDTSSAALDIFGRRGADDPKGHIRGEGVGHPVKSQDESFTVARRGAGEPGDVRGEGAGHPVKSQDESFTVARRGAGEPGDIRGEGAGHPVKSQDESFTVARRGRGADDPKGHIRGEGVGHPVTSDTPEVSIT